jgi:predicted GNAT family N-acyltransferase
MENPGDITIQLTTVEMIRPLRHVVLRAGLPPEAAVFDGDDEPASRHVAGFERSGRVVGCASIVQRPWLGIPAWQLRGMAVDPSLRGRGVGRQLLVMIEQIVTNENYPPMLWCNARTPAVGFYLAMGWTAVGDEFVIETAGPHYRMLKRLSQSISQSSGSSQLK